MEQTKIESEIQSLIVAYLKGIGVSQRKFAEVTGLSDTTYGTYSRMTSAMGADSMDKILTAYPELRKVLINHLTGNNMENNTHTQKRDEIKDNPLGEEAARIYAELYQRFLGANSEYLVIHRDVLKEHRLVAVEQLEKEKQQAQNAQQEISERMKQIEKLTDMIGVAASPNKQLPDPKRTQKDT